MSSIKRLSITDFLSEVPPEYSGFISQAHELLTKCVYTSKVQSKKHGFSIQYNSQNIKGRLALQFFIRNNALYLYLYNTFFYEFKNFLDNMPSVIIEECIKYRNCTLSCGPPPCTGTGRLEYTINGTPYCKCGVGRILFAVNDEVIGLLPVLRESANKT